MLLVFYIMRSLVRSTSTSRIIMLLIKSLFFAFIISSISSFYGYTVKGGSIEVGKASTDAVVMSNIMILLVDVLLTKLLMM